MRSERSNDNEDGESDERNSAKGSQSGEQTEQGCLGATATMETCDKRKSSVDLSIIKGEKNVERPRTSTFKFQVGLAMSTCSVEKLLSLTDLVVGLCQHGRRSLIRGQFLTMRASDHCGCALAIKLDGLRTMFT